MTRHLLIMIKLASRPNAVLNNGGVFQNLETTATGGAVQDDRAVKILQIDQSADCYGTRSWLCFVLRLASGDYVR